MEAPYDRSHQSTRRTRARIVRRMTYLKLSRRLLATASSTVVVAGLVSGSGGLVHATPAPVDGNAVTSDAAPTARILGGRMAERNQFPWMVQTFKSRDDSNCGAMVVKPRWVLSAAHCYTDPNDPTDDSKLSDWRVRVGSIWRTRGGRIINITRGVYYPQVGVDLILLRLAKPAGVPTVGLLGPKNRKPYKPGASAITMGWGVTAQDSDRQRPRLYWIRQITRDVDSCGRESTSVFCAGRKANRGSGTCDHDSGGPYLWAKNGFMADGTPRSKPVVAGVLSGLTNETCGVRGKNDDFTKIGSGYARWLKSILNPRR